MKFIRNFNRREIILSAVALFFFILLVAYIRNLPPAVDHVQLFPNPAQVNKPAKAFAVFVDYGSKSHTASWDWGDGNTTTGTVTEGSGLGQVSSHPHTYTASGIYTVALTLTNNRNIKMTISNQVQVESPGRNRPVSSP
jgi:PKD repeat protein